jgi:hypothetical protein
MQLRQRPVGWPRNFDERVQSTTPETVLPCAHRLRGHDGGRLANRRTRPGRAVTHYERILVRQTRSQKCGATYAAPPLSRTAAGSVGRRLTLASNSNSEGEQLLRLALDAVDAKNQPIRSLLLGPKRAGRRSASDGCTDAGPWVAANTVAHKVSRMNTQKRQRPSRGMARYLRRQLAAARRSGDPRRITAAEAEVAAARLVAARAPDPTRSKALSASVAAELDSGRVAASDARAAN